MSKVILLTGASRGIGLATAHHLLNNSHKVVLVARSESPLRDLESQYPHQVAFIAGDLGDFTLSKRAVDLAIGTWKQLDGVIVNHGVLEPVKKLADSTAEEWRSAFDTNFFSAVSIAQAALPALRESHGTILFTSSGAATNSYPTWGAYGSAKAAMNHLAQTIANEEEDVISIAIRPGVVDTEMQQEIREKHHDAMYPSDRARFAELKKTGGLLRPEQPGNVMARLVLSAPKALNGRFLSWNSDELQGYQED